MDILDLLRKIEDKNNLLTDVMGADSFLSEIIDNLWDIIMDIYQIPPDNTADFMNMDECEKSGKCFCRDGYIEALYDFSNRKITKKELIEILKKI